ncbi:MAG: hypothetical protein NTZ44_00165 [Candidatus Nomurabacteria bacterium]|nr:hypothetical protein [Candidatus Nomurabacteria bacterium]
MAKKVDQKTKKANAEAEALKKEETTTKLFIDSLERKVVEIDGKFRTHKIDLSSIIGGSYELKYLVKKGVDGIPTILDFLEKESRLKTTLPSMLRVDLENTYSLVFHYIACGMNGSPTSPYDFNGWKNYAAKLAAKKAKAEQI